MKIYPSNLWGNFTQKNGLVNWSYTLLFSYSYSAKNNKFFYIKNYFIALKIYPSNLWENFTRENGKSYLVWCSYKDEVCYLRVITTRFSPHSVISLWYFQLFTFQNFNRVYRCGLTFPKLKATVGIHPTNAEEFTRILITKRSGMDPKPQSCCS